MCASRILFDLFHRFPYKGKGLSYSVRWMIATIYAQTEISQIFNEKTENFLIVIHNF